ncbi:MAG: hypothetical protein B1H06_07060 [Candidatus Cloacimonas sp. 4484_143]|nr:MAG: hypothetical protein B1H06_07060 [Candidatus Cloacimonas sp. 4484_143]RLC53448.1 MAG: hypothetical protein DRI23_00195 [Candidatus Cloacimonadota bacterium]RLC53839.1 MAG: hypothetical protein DRH79_02500 [Candidatus Cloacimonadota bacterium]
MDPKVEKFLEDNNMTYLYLLLANLEVERLSNLPFTVKKQMKGKITNIALEHIAANDIPDYVMQEFEEQETSEIDE